MTENYQAKISSVIAFDVEYESCTGHKYHEAVYVDMSEHKGAYQLGKPHLYTIAQSLEKLQKDVGHVVSGVKRIEVNVFTAADREAEDEQWSKDVEEMK